VMFMIMIIGTHIFIVPEKEIRVSVENPQSLSQNL